MHRQLLRLIFVLGFLVASHGPATAATIEKLIWNNGPAVRLSGPILPGDRDQLARALEATTPRQHGAIALILDSPGGSVVEAFAISDLLELHDVHTIVPNGAHCASACASIVFISGLYRTVEPDGLIGHHSCSVNGEVLQSCNDALAEHAITHGVSHGSIGAFVTGVPPEELLWFTRENVDCWGLTRYPFAEETGFILSEPCVFRNITGREPEIQTAWRVDVLGDGFRAFSRVISDEVRELEVGFFCEAGPSPTYFISVEIGGPAEVIQEAIRHGGLNARGFDPGPRDVEVRQVDQIYSRALVPIDPQEAALLIDQVPTLDVLLTLNAPYTNIFSPTRPAGSSAALSFAAAHCATPGS